MTVGANHLWDAGRIEIKYWYEAMAGFGTSLESRYWGIWQECEDVYMFNKVHKETLYTLFFRRNFQR